MNIVLEQKTKDTTWIEHLKCTCTMMQWWGTFGSNSSILILLVRVWKYVCLDTHTSMAAEPDVVTNKKTKTAEYLCLVRGTSATSAPLYSSAASDVNKRQIPNNRAWVPPQLVNALLKLSERKTSRDSLAAHECKHAQRGLSSRSQLIASALIPY